MSRRLLCVAVVACCLAIGCGEPIHCGVFEWDPDRNACVCPRGSMELEDGSCMLADGGVIVPPGRDASTLDASIEAGRADADLDASVHDVDGCAPTTFYADLDGDGFGDPASAVVACSAPTDHVRDATDCDDGCGACHPGAAETCDARDEDCDGLADPDEDELCPFGQACLDTICTAIPIYSWDMHLRARSGSSVSNVVVDDDPTGGVFVLVSHVGVVDVATRTIGRPGAASITMLELDASGSLEAVTEIAIAFDPARVTASSVAVDAAGVVYLVGTFTSSAQVLSRSLSASSGASFLAAIRPDGTDWVQRFGMLTFTRVAARTDGWIACGTFLGSITLRDAHVADADGDGVIVLGDGDGSVQSEVVFSGVGAAPCEGLDSEGDVHVVSGTYRGAQTISGTGFTLGDPRGTDAWAVGLTGSSASVDWRLVGGSPYSDLGEAIVHTGTATYIAASVASDARFGTSSASPSDAIALVRYVGGIATPLFSSCSGSDGDSPVTEIAEMDTVGAGSPALALTLQTGLAGSRLDFGTARAESVGGASAVVLGYSMGGDAERWILHTTSSGEAVATSMSRLGTSQMVLAGMFEGTIGLDATHSRSSAGGYDGFVAAFRVR